MSTPALRRFRERRGLTLRRVAELAAVDPSSLSRHERFGSGLGAAALGRVVGVLGLDGEDLAVLHASSRLDRSARADTDREAVTQ